MAGENLQTEYRTIYFALEGKAYGKDRWACREIKNNRVIAALVWDEEWQSHGIEFKEGKFLYKEVIENINHFMGQLSE